MCTLIAKKFPNIGWVGVKNRDRSAPTETELLRDQEDRFQRVTLMDETTRWTEGMNSNGVSIISSSLYPIIHGDPGTHRTGGSPIRNALAQPTVEKAVRYLEKVNAHGCVMVFDRNHLWLIEGKVNSNQQVVRKITDDYIARTNHGVWIPSAGYQPHSKNKILAMRRISSIARLKIANFILDSATKPDELMPLLAKQWIDNPQLTTLRTPIPGIDTRTTEQLMLEPGKKLVIVRNVNGILEFNQEDANPPGSEVLVGVVQS